MNSLNIATLVYLTHTVNTLLISINEQNNISFFIIFLSDKDLSFLVTPFMKSSAACNNNLGEIQ